MKMKQLAICATWGLALSLIAPFAAALPSASTSASVSNMQFLTVDLTPDDSLTGGISAFAGGSTLTAYVGSQTRYYSYVPMQPFGATVADNFGSASISQSGVPGEIAAQSTTRGYDYAGGWGSQNARFWLLPHTSLSVTGHIATAAHSDPILTAPRGAASASATLGSWDSWVNVSYRAYVDDFVPDMVRSEDFAMKYENNTDAAVLMNFSTYISIDASNGIYPAVPEPEGYAMLGAGLALFGLMGRRRKPR